LCVPALVAQPNISHERQSKYLLYALGALRILRGKQRIVPDEAAYRALIVACGRTKSDRRMELVKLFGLLRSDGIFPSAVTLGQYTRALAEGYSKRSIGVPEEDAGTGEVSDPKSGPNSSRGIMDPEIFLSTLDGNCAILEDAGRRWRQKSSQGKESVQGHDGPSSSALSIDRQKKRSKPWLPVATSSSFVPPSATDTGSRAATKLSKESICLLAVWSRTKSCDCKSDGFVVFVSLVLFELTPYFTSSFVLACGYVPLDEEVRINSLQVYLPSDLFTILSFLYAFRSKLGGMCFKRMNLPGL